MNLVKLGFFIITRQQRTLLLLNIEDLLQIYKMIIILELLHNSKSSSGVWEKSISEIFF